MMNPLDKLLKLQQAWQSQCNRSLDINPDQLLQTARLERRTYLWADMFVIAVFLCCGGWMFWSAFQDIQDDWPWLVYSACCAWVVGYILFNRWRRRRFAAHYDDSLLAHVEWSINDLEHRMRLDRYTLWWYILPIALGCMIPPAIFFVIEFEINPKLDDLFAFLIAEAMFIAIFWFIHWIMKKLQRVGRKGQQKELLALRALRETLLNEGAGK